MYLHTVFCVICWAPAPWTPPQPAGGRTGPRIFGHLRDLASGNHIQIFWLSLGLLQRLVMPPIPVAPHLLSFVGFVGVLPATFLSRVCHCPCHPMYCPPSLVAPLTLKAIGFLSGMVVPASPPILPHPSETGTPKSPTQRHAPTRPMPSCLATLIWPLPWFSNSRPCRRSGPEILGELCSCKPDEAFRTSPTNGHSQPEPHPAARTSPPRSSQPSGCERAAGHRRPP